MTSDEPERRGILTPQLRPIVDKICAELATIFAIKIRALDARLDEKSHNLEKLEAFVSRLESLVQRSREFERTKLESDRILLIIGFIKVGLMTNEEAARALRPLSPCPAPKPKRNASELPLKASSVVKKFVRTGSVSRTPLFKKG